MNSSTNLVAVSIIKVLRETMYRIAIDITPLRTKPSGIGMYISNLIQGLTELPDAKDFSFGLVYQPSFKKWLRGDVSLQSPTNFDLDVTCLPLPVTITNLLAQFPNLILPYVGRRLSSFDLIQGTDHYVYPVKDISKILTIHDLTFLKYPEYVNNIVKNYGGRVKQCLKWTDLVITFSHNSQQEISQYLGIMPEKIVVIPQASRFYSTGIDEVSRLENQVNYDFSQPYLLFVSTIEPRKNIVNLVAAFNYLKKQEKIPHQLVLIGQKGWRYQEIFQAIANSPYQTEIHHLDYLRDDLVKLFYQRASVFVYPSHYEGFGLPILEAMNFKIPVVTSNTSSLPEVAGDAAILVNPQDSLEIAKAIARILGDATYRENLILAGNERVKLYSWEKTASATLEAYRRLLSA